MIFHPTIYHFNTFSSIVVSELHALIKIDPAYRCSPSLGVVSIGQTKWAKAFCKYCSFIISLQMYLLNAHYDFCLVDSVIYEYIYIYMS